MPEVGRPVRCRIGPAWPRSSSWLVPPPSGRCSRWASSLRQRDQLLATLQRVGACRVFERLQELLLGEAGGLDWSRVRPDSCSLRAVRGDLTGANPVDRAKGGSRLHLAVEGGGLPLSLLVTGAKINDSIMFEVLLDDIPPVRTPAGRRRRRPDTCHADRAYDTAVAAATCRGQASRSASPAAGSSRLSGWVATAKRPTARSPGWPGAGGCAPATTARRSGFSLGHAGLRPAVLQPPARRHPAARALAVITTWGHPAGQYGRPSAGRGQTAAPPD
jgi:hypothetical protein